MAFNDKGFITLSHIGSIDGAAGANRALHAYVTSDDRPTVVSSGYFDPLAARLKTGDLILAAFDIAGSATADLVVVTGNTSGTVTTAAVPPGGVTGGQAHIAPLVDNSTGTPSGTIEEISNAATADAIASLNAKLTAVLGVLEAAGLTEDD